MAKQKKQSVNVLQKLGMGVKRTFGIKELTPQQKADVIKKANEARAYRQILAQKERIARQQAYAQEIVNQRQLLAMQREEAARQRGMNQARADAQRMAQPQGNWFSNVTTGLSKAFPAPPAKVQAQLDRSIGNVRTQPRQAAPVMGSSWDSSWGAPTPQPNKKKQHLKHLGTPQGSVFVDLIGTQVVSRQPKRKPVKSSVNSSLATELMWNS